MVEAQILEEIRNNRYMPVKVRPRIISALGAIRKNDGTQVRLIHDCSRPIGQALNDLAFKEKFRYQSIQDAIALIKPSSFIAKCDLSSAYRSVSLHPDDWNVSGIAWCFGQQSHTTFLIDKRLMMGASRAPFIFHQLSQAVCRIMESLGFPGVICYLDDFLVVRDNYRDCQLTLMTLMKVLRDLGFAINYKKLETAAKKVTFLGVELDTEELVMRLPDSKLERLLHEVHQVYQATSASKRDLQSLLGRLSWASLAIQGARPHLRRLLDRINRLQGPRHRTRITIEMKKDLAWWIAFARIFNGSVPMLDYRNHLSVSIDACSEGAGGFSGGDCYHLDWKDWPGAYEQHINYKEVLALEPALTLWAPSWANHVVDIYSDNQAAVAIINRGSCRDNPFVMDSLRRVFWLSAVYNIKLHAWYLEGTRNTLADACSRVPNRTAWTTLLRVLQQTFIPDNHSPCLFYFGTSSGRSNSTAYLVGPPLQGPLTPPTGERT